MLFQLGRRDTEKIGRVRLLSLAMQMIDGTRRSVPDDLRRAQSRGEWPGARTTFCLGRALGGSIGAEGDSVLLFMRIRVVEGGSISEFTRGVTGSASRVTSSLGTAGGRTVGALGVFWSSISESEAPEGVEGSSGRIMEAFMGVIDRWV